MKKSLIYIIILNWNGYKDTMECIESLNKVNYNNFKIVVVDNASTNNSVKIIRSKFPDIDLIVNKTNLGYAEGNNVGIKYALINSADYVLLINNDTIVNNNLLIELISTAESNQNIGIVSPIIYYYSNPDIIWSTGRFRNYKGLYPYIDPEFLKKDTGYYKTTEEVDGVTGCCILVKRKVFETVGFFDKDYFLYVEDTDLCIRVKRAGYSIVYNPNAKVWHKVSRSSGGDGSKIIDYYLNRNLILFARKNLSGRVKFIYLLYLLFGRLLLLGVFIKKRKFKRINPSITGLMHGFIDRRGYYQFN